MKLKFTISGLLKFTFVSMVLVALAANPYVQRMQVIITGTEQCVWIVDSNEMPVYRIGFIDHRFVCDNGWIAMDKLPASGWISRE